ncbi:ADP-ribose pyrophosphatase [Vibrio chagasii]|uniref:nucleotide triphosphate diphosphatase NUDT15 n=1 Tax=Vibrio chagasii TaxID=170679 RepID=UPI0016421D2F|nr:NUDIX hydrolase [Vibrio chagasii]CAH6993682.1 ADP-ribose pyrophosphatase [Vibrio chagasii]CAH6994210.1 ADP-ribose pyrophosphatase [Vibrio chagasii]CAH7216626.1 ADP-ribose pyrophosphatase [Vibrio chagasii]CAH7318901.1 ADP-ribose pyrophosphatase [Vibrio chagasii]CAH7352829.1 ADP-ribose pyrophosphatase [Vibrio chagasii]
MNNQVRVGVAAVIFREGRILLGERIGSHGANTWATPGGHLEIGESIEECAQRETFEETGLEVGSFKKLGFTNDIFEKEGKHYVTLYVVATRTSGEPQVMEPHQCKQWQWFDLDELPEPLFLPLVNLLKEPVNFKNFD